MVPLKKPNTRALPGLPEVQVAVVRHTTFGDGSEQLDGPRVPEPPLPVQPSRFAAVGFPPLTVFWLTRSE